MSAAARRRRLVAALPEDVDALLLTDLVNVRWASGFSGSFGALLVERSHAGGGAGRGWLATDGRYRLRAAGEAPEVSLVVTRRPAAELIAGAAKRGRRRVGFEAEHLSVAAYDDLAATAGDLGVELVACRHLVQRLRAVKDPDELDGLRRACAATDEAFAQVLPAVRQGLTERQIEARLTAALREAGADGPAFDAIVASGPNSAVPHHRPTDRRLQPGDFVTMDFGAMVAGMHADMTRTVVVGRAAEWQRDVYAAVHDLQQRMCDRVRPDVVPVELDTAAALAIREFGAQPAHGLGHGVGLQIHEEPWLTPDSTSGPLRPHTPVTVEPGIYLEGRGGVRIEDTVLVTATGQQPLTTSPRELLEL